MKQKLWQVVFVNFFLRKSLLAVYTRQDYENLRNCEISDKFLNGNKVLLDSFGIKTVCFVFNQTLLVLWIFYTLCFSGFLKNIKGV